MSASQARQFLDSLESEADLDGSLTDLAADQGYDLSTEEIRAEIRSRLADDQGVHLDPDGVEEYQAVPATCYTWCWDCPLDDC